MAIQNERRVNRIFISPADGFLLVPGDPAPSELGEDHHLDAIEDNRAQLFLSREPQVAGDSTDALLPNDVGIQGLHHLREIDGSVEIVAGDSLPADYGAEGDVTNLLEH